jgi:zinc protease
MSPVRGRAVLAALTLISVLAPAMTAVPPAEAQPAAQPTPALVALPDPSSPLVTVRLEFAVGSIHDPRGKEGLAALTSLMVAEAATQRRSYPELLEALYPMAASLEADVDREVSVFGGTVHRDTLVAYTDLLLESLLQPAFGAEDFERNQDQLVSYLTNPLRSNDELLGLEVLQQEIWAGHPYGHSPAGTVAGLGALTLEDVRAFHRQRYTRANLTLGLAGGYPADWAAKLQERLRALPAGTAAAPIELPAPRPARGRQVLLVEKETGSVGLHFGHALPLTRADADFYPLLVAASYLGEHRTSHGRLFQELREKRGLNYGDYAYVEYWDNPPFTNNPSPHVPRRQQYFSVWIRPVVPADGRFALRAALAEVARLRERGLDRAEFELTRDFLVRYTKLWAQTQEDRLGFHMDSRFYGMPYYIDEIEKRLAAVTLEQVNAAARKYLKLEDLYFVVVTDEAAKLAAELTGDAPSPKTYNAEVEPGVVEADKAIIALSVKPAATRVLAIDKVFAE